MREAIDEFGQKLRELRRARGVTGDRLSRDIGGYKTLIGNMERERRAVSVETLQRIADTLGLSSAEFDELSRLAALRRVPEELRSQISPPADSDANLLRALLERDHYWPDEPKTANPHSHLVKVLLDAVAWAVLRREWSGESAKGEALCRRVAWPSPILQLGLAHHPEVENALDISLDAVRQEVPSIDRAVVPSGGAASEPFFEGLCRAMRRTFFSDLNRTCEALERIEYWEYGKTPAMVGCCSIHFKDHIVRGDDGVPVYVTDMVQDVTCQIIADVELRRLAEPVRNRASLALSGGAHPRDWPWPGRFGVRSLDLAVSQTVALSQTRSRETYEDGQDLRDASYVIESHALRGCDVDVSSDAGRRKRTDLERQLLNGRLEDSMRQRVAALPSLLTAEADIFAIAEYLHRQHAPCERADRERAIRNLAARGAISTETAKEELSQSYAARRKKPARTPVKKAAKSKAKKAKKRK